VRGIEAVASNTETCYQEYDDTETCNEESDYTETYDQEYDMDLTVPQSVEAFDWETVLIPPADLTLRFVETNMLLKTECQEASNDKEKNLNDKEKNLKEIEELMNTIRGSLVGDPHPAFVAIAKEALKVAVSQITDASHFDFNLLNF